MVVAAIGSPAELTRVCTLVRLLEGAGKTTALASESSFCKASESLAGASVAVRGAAVPVELGATFLVEKRTGEIAGVGERVPATIAGRIEANGALGLVGTETDWLVADAGAGSSGGAGEFAATVIGSGFTVGTEGGALGAGKLAVAARVVLGTMAGAAPGNAESVGMFDATSVGGAACGA